MPSLICSVTSWNWANRRETFGRFGTPESTRRYLVFPPLLPRRDLRIGRYEHQRQNGLACLTDLRSLKQPVKIRPLPGLPVIRDLIVDMTQFFKQYHSVKPYVVNDNPIDADKERLQTQEERKELDGLYECILCACCSTACPSFWWNPDKFVGPSGLLNAYRFIADSRDTITNERLDNLNDPYRLFRCHTIMNCVDVCPKHLNPTRTIGKIKEIMLKRVV